MSIKSKKPTFLVDNDTRYSEFEILYKKKAKFFSTKDLIGRSNAGDDEIFTKCSSKNVHIITRNSDDFFPQQKTHPSSKIGVIGIGSKNITQSIRTFRKLLVKFPNHKDYYRKSITVTSKSFLIK